MADMFDRMTVRDVALACLAAQKIMIEALDEADRASVRATLHDKAQQFLGVQFEEGAGQLLRMMAGVRGAGAADG